MNTKWALLAKFAMVKLRCFSVPDSFSFFASIPIDFICNYNLTKHYRKAPRLCVKWIFYWNQFQYQGFITQSVEGLINFQLPDKNLLYMYVARTMPAWWYTCKNDIWLFFLRNTKNTWKEWKRNGLSTTSSIWIPLTHCVHQIDDFRDVVQVSDEDDLLHGIRCDWRIGLLARQPYRAHPVWVVAALRERRETVFGGFDQGVSGCHCPWLSWTQPNMHFRNIFSAFFFAYTRRYENSYIFVLSEYRMNRLLTMSPM